MQRTNIYLEERQTRELDALAADAGVSRAEVIRRLIDQGLQRPGLDVAADLVWFDSSFGVEVEFDIPSREPRERERWQSEIAE